MSDPQMPLPEDEAHVWLAFPDAISSVSRLECYLAELDDTERARLSRFRFNKDRHLFLVAHALVRRTLSRYASVAPAGWTFALGEVGRPEIAGPEAALDLRFNLSHTRGLCALLVTRHIDCGVDVEDGRRLEDPLALVERYFAPSEVACVRALKVTERRERFFTYWTLKEAYIKARGLGLRLPLSGFWFLLEEQDGIRIRFDVRVPDDPAAWQFAASPATAHHRLAIALRSGAAERRVVVRTVVP